MGNISDDEKTIQHHFDSFCKTILRHQARVIYEAECILFSTLDYEIPIEDILMAQAIQSLLKRRQNTILLSFFLDMKEMDITTLMSFA